MTSNTDHVESIPMKAINRRMLRLEQLGGTRLGSQSFYGNDMLHCDRGAKQPVSGRHEVYYQLKFCACGMQSATLTPSEAGAAASQSSFRQ
jgi:hypothetical protein